MVLLLPVENTWYVSLHIPTSISPEDSGSLRKPPLSKFDLLALCVRSLSKIVRNKQSNSGTGYVMADKG